MDDNQSEALALLKTQSQEGRQLHDPSCAWKVAHNLGERNVAWAEVGCRRCAAWRALGFNSPREVLSDKEGFVE